MADLKKQCLRVKLCIQFGKTAQQEHEMLKTAVGDNAMD
jgi:hypothetical protein